MTDYLSQLLEEQELEREQDALGVILPAGGASFLRQAHTKGRRGPEAPAAGVRGAAEAADREKGLAEAPDMQERYGAAAGARWPERAGAEGIALTAGLEAIRKNGSAALAGQEGGRAGLEDFFAEKQADIREFPEHRERTPPQWLLQAGAGIAAERGTGAGWLYRRLNAGQAAAGYRGTQRSGNLLREGGENPSPGGGISPEELDRALERDARRYGGGFALF